MQRLINHIALRRTQNTRPQEPDDALLYSALRDEACTQEALAALPWNALAAIARNGSRARGLLIEACDADLPRSVALIRRRLMVVPGHATLPTVRALAERGWEMGRQHMAFILVTQNLRTPKEFMQRFPDARACWVRLIDEGYVPPGHFMRHFVSSTEERERWTRRAQLVGGRAPLLLPWSGHATSPHAPVVEPIGRELVVRLKPAALGESQCPPYSR